VNRDDSGALITLFGLTALTIGVTDLVARYLRPVMARWLVLAGVVIVALGVTVLVSSWRTRRHTAHDAARDEREREHDHPLPAAGPPGPQARHRPSRAGWLLLVPVIVAIVVDPGALGSYAVGQQSSFRVPASRHFDLEAYLRSRSFAGQAVELSILQLWQAVDGGDQLDVLADTTLSLEGFVVHDDSLVDGFVLARLLIGCCAGDALPITVEVDGDAATDLADDTWVRARVNFDPVATAAMADDGTEKAAVVDLVDLDEIEPPTEPYLYLW
jgi:uncharacterized repeat protein (TIGR03943 family)